MISLKLISVLLHLVTLVIIWQRSEAANITDSCIKKSPTIQIISTEKEPNLDKKSLMFIFDTTGSMQDNLGEYKTAAEEIVKEYTSRNDIKIFNYILIGFSDPDVSVPFITENVTEIIQELRKVEVVPSANFDCPENALAGLKAGLDVALPKSMVYLFTDAPSNDFELYNNVSLLILKKQITVNFLISDSCGQRHHNDDRFKVFTKISNLSNGLTYEVQTNSLNNIKQNIKDEINSKHKILKTIKSERNKRINFDFDVDDSVTELKLSMAGKDQYSKIKNPRSLNALTKQKFTTDGIKILYFKNPEQGSWKLRTKDDFVTISVMSDLEFDFGFSVDIVAEKSETVGQPISGVKNILSIFVPDPSQIENLSKISLLHSSLNESEDVKEESFNLNKQNNELYTTNLFQLPKTPFKIYLEGKDRNDHEILRTISPILYEDAGTAPEVTIEAEKLELYEEQDLKLQCIVKSLVPVDIAWTFDGKILESLSSIRSYNFPITIQNISYDQKGTYKCVAVNQVGCETNEVRIGITKKPQLKIITSSNEVIENSSLMLTCQLDGITKGQNIEYSWFEEDGNLIHNSGNTHSFIPIAEDHNKAITCQANCSDFTIKSSTTLNINYSPRFVTSLHNNIITFGSKVRLNCSTTENPAKRFITWNFIANNSSKSVIINDENSSIFELKGAFENDEGTYQCIVGNEIGQISRNFTILLTPKDSPKIMFFKEVVVNETENANISCGCKIACRFQIIHGPLITRETTKLT